MEKLKKKQLRTDRVGLVLVLFQLIGSALKKNYIEPNLAYHFIANDYSEMNVDEMICYNLNGHLKTYMQCKYLVINAYKYFPHFVIVKF